MTERMKDATLTVQKRKPDWWKGLADYYTAEEAKQSLKYPELRFPYELVCRGSSKLKELIDKACEGGLDPGLVVPALFALASGVPEKDAHVGTRINRYVCLLAMVGAGKDVAQRRALAVLGFPEKPGAMHNFYSPQGDASIIGMLGNRAGRKTQKDTNPTPIPGPRRMVWITPELSGVIKRARGQGSAILECLQEFYDRNQFEHYNSKTQHMTRTDCRLSLSTNLPVGEGEIDDREYARVFGQDTGHGLLSRFDLGFSEKRVDPRLLEDWIPPAYSVETPIGIIFDTLEDHSGPVTPILRSPVTDMLSFEVEGYSPGVKEMYLAWTPTLDASGRDSSHLKKTMLVIALINGHRLVSEEDFESARAYMEWQQAIRGVFSASKADPGPQAQFNEYVMKCISRKANELAKKDVPVKERWVNWKRLSLDLKWHLRDTPLGVERTIEALIKSGQLVQMEELEERADGKEAKKKKKVENFVRLTVPGGRT